MRAPWRAWKSRTGFSVRRRKSRFQPFAASGYFVRVHVGPPTPWCVKAWGTYMWTW